MFCKYPVGDLNARLSGTICRYDGMPYLIQVTERGTVRLDDMVSGEGGARIDPSDPKFDISTPPLGYVNFREHCKYLTRIPTRRYKQGIDNRNTIMSPIPGPNIDRMGRNGHTLHCVEVRNMMLNKYEDSRAVLKALREGRHVSRAISRSVAFSIDGIGLVSVYLKNNIVGHIYPDKEIITVPTSDMGWVVSVHINGFGFEVD